MAELFRFCSMSNVISLCSVLPVVCVLALTATIIIADTGVDRSPTHAVQCDGYSKEHDVEGMEKR